MPLLAIRDAIPVPALTMQRSQLILDAVEAGLHAGGSTDFKRESNVIHIQRHRLRWLLGRRHALALAHKGRIEVETGMPGYVHLDFSSTDLLFSSALGAAGIAYIFWDPSSPERGLALLAAAIPSMCALNYIFARVGMRLWVSRVLRYADGDTTVFDEKTVVKGAQEFWD